MMGPFVMGPLVMGPYVGALYIYHFYKLKRHKEVKKTQNSGNQGFSYYFCLMIEGPEPDTGGPKTNKSR